MLEELCYKTEIHNVSDSYLYPSHNGEQLNPMKTMRRIREDLPVLEIPNAHAQVLLGHGWRPPEAGMMKTNTDAAFDFELGKCGAGGVARADSKFIGAWSIPHLGVTDPF